jgi:hypothetical protein
MTTFAGPLRAARAEILPHIPELAPRLKKNPYVILEALEDTFVENGHDVTEVPDVDWNKTERHTIAGFGAHAQSEYLVEGTGADARFTQFQTDKKGERDLDAFRKDLKATQAFGARYVRDTYTGGTDAEHSWWPRAARRYRWLGAAAMRPKFRRGDTTVVGPTVPLEGVFMHKALRTDALISATREHLKVVRTVGKDLPRSERLQAAHDIAYLTTTLAGLHFLELTQGKVTLPDIKLAKDQESGQYRPIYEDRGSWRKMYPRFHTLPTVRLKCPAHVHPETPGVEGREESPLQNLFHAAINAAVEYEYDIL